MSRLNVSYPPILVLGYNRPYHIKKMLNSLARNPEAKESILIACLDGAKVNSSQEDIKSIEEVREVVRNHKGFGKVEVVVREQNLGLRNNVKKSVSDVLERFESVIVLEDDLILSKGFLAFMHQGLETYKNEARVMHVSGFVKKITVKEEYPDVAFIQVPHSYGWGTWRRAWKYYEDDTKFLLAEVEKKGKASFDFNHTYNFYRMLKNADRGVIDSWAVRWYASIFLRDGLCLNPTKSLVGNIGDDGTGTHFNSKFSSETVDSVKFMPRPLVVDDLIYKKYQAFFLKDRLLSFPSFYFLKFKNKLKCILSQ